MAIPWSLPAFDDAEERAVLETLRSGWLTMGPRTRAFERGIAELLGVELDQHIANVVEALQPIAPELGLRVEAA